ncbi:MAG: ribosome assembly cofactor RimP, partial [Prevotella sp.]
MKQQEQLEQAAAAYLEGKDLFLVDIKVSADNDIDITIESDGRDVTLDDCVGMTEFIQQAVDRDQEDYSLTIGSAGLTSPFKVLRQWKKAVGSEIQL